VPGQLSPRGGGGGLLASFPIQVGGPGALLGPAGPRLAAAAAADSRCCCCCCRRGGSCLAAVADQHITRPAPAA
jgi:hypothetical protein